MPAFDKDGSLIMGICNDRDINTRQQLREQLSTAKALATDYKVKALKCGQRWKPDIIAEAARSKKRLKTSLQGVQMDSLISGETGTDKEEISKLLYRNSHAEGICSN